MNPPPSIERPSGPDSVFVDPSVVEADAAIAAELAGFTEQFAHAEPRQRPPEQSYAEGVANGLRAGMRASRLEIAIQLERQGEALLVDASRFQPGHIQAQICDAKAAELFVQAARIRSAVTL